jgi:hypothetical protein
MFTEFDEARKVAATRRLEFVLAEAQERLPVETLERLGERLEVFLTSLDRGSGKAEQRAA